MSNSTLTIPAREFCGGCEFLGYTGGHVNNWCCNACSAAMGQNARLFTVLPCNLIDRYKRPDCPFKSTDTIPKEPEANEEELSWTTIKHRCASLTLNAPLSVRVVHAGNVWIYHTDELHLAEYAHTREEAEESFCRKIINQWRNVTDDPWFLYIVQSEDITLYNLSYKGRKFDFRYPLYIEALHSIKDCWLFLSKQFGINGSGKTRKEAFDVFLDNFSTAWDNSDLKDRLNPPGE